MPLDPEAKALLEQMTAVVRPFDELSVEEARAAIATLSAAAGEGEAVARVENRIVPGPRGEIPVRVYTPEGRAPFPVLVYFHGGGWVIGNLETHDGVCRHLANAAGAVVASVDYRLAPEHPFPASGEDAYAATRWVAANAAVIGGGGPRLPGGGGDPRGPPRTRHPGRPEALPRHDPRFLRHGLSPDKGSGGDEGSGGRAPGGLRPPLTRTGGARAGGGAAEATPAGPRAPAALRGDAA